MTNTLKTLAIVSLMGTASAPAFAASHMDLNSMTCGDYKQLSAEDQDKVAMMAVLELNDNGASMGGQLDENATADGTKAEENEGADTSSVVENSNASGNDKTELQEGIDILNRTCDRFADAMILEAAAGQGGTN